MPASPLHAGPLEEKALGPAKGPVCQESRTLEGVAWVEGDQPELGPSPEHISVGWHRAGSEGAVKAGGPGDLEWEWPGICVPLGVLPVCAGVGGGVYRSERACIYVCWCVYTCVLSTHVYCECGGVGCTSACPQHVHVGTNVSHPSPCVSITRASLASDLQARTTQGERAYYFWCPHQLLTALWN